MMQFSSLGGVFVISFLQENLRDQVCLPFRTTDPQVLLDLFERGAESRLPSDRQSFDLAVQSGRGGCWLKLNSEQYTKLIGRE